MELAAALQVRSAGDYGENYQQHLLEQYKLVVEMADRVSTRRMQANTFFLGINTGVLIVFARLVREKLLSGYLGALPILALLCLCFVWSQIVTSYRQINSGKYKVIQQMEQLLPTAPYATEWMAMGHGNNPKFYLPLTHVEIWVPRLFGILYLSLLLAVLFSGQAPATAPAG
jgi:hypothetical protein